MSKSRSRTKGSHTNLAGSKVYKTTITQDNQKTTGYGYSPKQSQKSASKKAKGGGAGSPCLVSSACIRALKLPDDCAELEALRTFRDTYVFSLPQGGEEVERYYRKAPGLVQAIDSRDDALAIYRSVYRNMVAPCVALIRSGDQAAALQLYREQIERLEDSLT